MYSLTFFIVISGMPVSAPNHTHITMASDNAMESTPSSNTTVESPNPGTRKTTVLGKTTNVRNKKMHHLLLNQAFAIFDLCLLQTQ